MRQCTMKSKIEGILKNNKYPCCRINQSSGKIKTLFLQTRPVWFQSWAHGVLLLYKLFTVFKEMLEQLPAEFLHFWRNEPFCDILLASSMDTRLLLLDRKDNGMEVIDCRSTGKLSEEWWRSSLTFSTSCNAPTIDVMDLRKKWLLMSWWWSGSPV